MHENFWAYIQSAALGMGIRYLAYFRHADKNRHPADIPEKIQCIPASAGMTGKGSCFI